MVSVAFSEALPADVKDRCVVEDAVERAEKRVVLVEVLLQREGLFVAREDDVVRALFVVPTVDHVEEQPRVFLVELTVADLVNDQAGRPDKAGQRGRLFCPDRRAVNLSRSPTP